MNYLDIIIVLPLLYGAIKGFLNGLVKEITGVLGLIIGVYVAVNFASYLYPKATEFLAGYEQFVPIIAFATLFVVSILAISLLGNILEKLTKILALGIIIRILGSIFGFLKAIILVSFVLFILTEHKLINQQIQKESVLLNPIQEGLVFIIPKINKHKNEALDAIETHTKKAKEEINKKVNSQ